MRAIIVIILWFIPSIASAQSQSPQGRYVEINAGKCRIIERESVRQYHPTDRFRWTGPCKDGYAQGVGIFRVYEKSRLVSIGKAELSRGHPIRSIEAYALVNGQLVKVVHRTSMAITHSQLPEWARGLGSAAEGVQAPQPKKAQATKRQSAYFGVDVGQCHAFLYNIPKSEKIRWTGACQNGYANGAGILRVYNASGRLVQISKAVMNRGRPTTFGETYMPSGQNRILRTTEPGVARPQRIAIADIPPWAREILSSISASRKAQPTRRQSASLAGTHTFVDNCTRGTRFNGYGTKFTVQVPDSSLQNLESSSYITSLLNQAMINAIKYCNNQAGHQSINQSSRFFGAIDTNSHFLYPNVVSATKEIGQDTWTIAYNNTTSALQIQKQREARQQSQMQAQQRALQDEESDRLYAKQHRAALTASIPAMPQQITESTACKIAMADLVMLPPPLKLTNYCPYGHSRHFSRCTDYLSDVAQGWAKLSIPYSYHGCYGETVNAVAEYKFRHFDQGWKMFR